MTKIRREPVETFSVGYTEQTYSELPFAHTVSDHIKSKHHEVLVSEEEFFGALPHLIWHEDEPITWPSSISLYFVARLARERVTVVLTDEFAREAAPSTAYKHVLAYWERSSGEMLQRLLYTDIKTYLVELLMKQDNMSMAASIESRVPFLDHVLVEFATRIPREVQIQGLAGKRILKKAAEDLLPHSILYRTKLGFPTPWSGWLAGPRLESIREMLLEPRSLNRGYFRCEAVEKLFNEHRAKHRDNYDGICRLLHL